MPTAVDAVNRFVEDAAELSEVARAHTRALESLGLDFSRPALESELRLVGQVMTVMGRATGERKTTLQGAVLDWRQAAVERATRLGMKQAEIAAELGCERHVVTWILHNPRLTAA